MLINCHAYMSFSDGFTSFFVPDICVLLFSNYDINNQLLCQTPSFLLYVVALDNPETLMQYKCKTVFCDRMIGAWYGNILAQSMKLAG